MKVSDIILLCENSVAMMASPETVGAMRQFVGEGIDGVAKDVKIAIFRYGNTLHDGKGCEWMTVNDFSSEKMFDSKVPGTSNIYLSLEQLWKKISRGLHPVHPVIVICTACGSSDSFDQGHMSNEARDFYENQSDILLVYGVENLNVELSNLSVSTDQIFTVGNEKEVNDFTQELKKLTSIDRSVKDEFSSEETGDQIDNNNLNTTNSNSSEWVEDEFS